MASATCYLNTSSFTQHKLFFHVALNLMTILLLASLVFHRKADATSGNSYSTKSIAAFFGSDALSAHSERLFNLSRKIQSVPGGLIPGKYKLLHRSSNDSFLLAFHLCKAFEYGISSVFSFVKDDVTIQAIDSFTRAFEVPHVTLYSKNVITSLATRQRNSGYRSVEPIATTFQLMPHIEKAVFDFMFFNNWTSAVVFYDDDTVNDNFRFSSTLFMRQEMAMEVKHVTSHKTARRYLFDYQQAVRNSETSGVNFLLLTSPKNTYMIVKEAESMQMLNRFNNYLVADTRVSCQEMNLTVTAQLNVFCFRHVISTDTQNELSNFKDFRAEMVRLIGQAKVTKRDNSENDESETNKMLRENGGISVTDYELALLADFHQIFNKIYSDPVIVRALDAFDPVMHSFQSPPRQQVKPCLDCQISPLAGYIIAKELRKLKMSGFSGNIEFDSNGLRKNFKLDIVQANAASTKTPNVVVGSWDDSNGYKFIEHKKEEPSTITLTNSVIRVVTIITEPFTMIKKDRRGDVTEGIENFEGFCIDMLNEIARETNMTFEVHLVHDGLYGEEETNGSWNGMIGELMRGQADVAVAPLTISSERQRVVDFTKPYMDVGVSIMMKIQDKEENMFSFLIPLQTDIWMCIILSYISVSVVYFVVSRISLRAWMRPEDRANQDEDFKYTLSNCFFLTLGAVLQRGEDMCTKESPISSRIVGGGWWFFTLIIISSYTANLAAFLTVDRMKTPINGAEDLAGQTAIEYGTLDSGSSKSFFKTSQIGTFQRMYKFMEGRDTFKPSVQGGVDAVRENQNYAFLLESTMNEYHNQQLPCNTRQIGNNLNSKNYGIATPSGSFLLKKLTVAILVLMERGYISERKNYWWYTRGECQFKKSTSSSENANALEIGDVWGVFYILIGGSIFGLLVCIVEFVLVSIHQSRRLKIPLSTVLRENFVHCARSMICSLPEREQIAHTTAIVRSPGGRESSLMHDFTFPPPPSHGPSLPSFMPASVETISRNFYTSSPRVVTEEDLSLLDMEKSQFVQL